MKKLASKTIRSSRAELDATASGTTLPRRVSWVWIVTRGFLVGIAMVIIAALPTQISWPTALRFMSNSGATTSPYSSLMGSHLSFDFPASWEDGGGLLPPQPDFGVRQTGFLTSGLGTCSSLASCEALAPGTMTLSVVDYGLQPPGTVPTIGQSIIVDGQSSRFQHQVDAEKAIVTDAWYVTDRQGGLSSIRASFPVTDLDKREAELDRLIATVRVKARPASPVAGSDSIRLAPAPWLSFAYPSTWTLYSPIARSAVSRSVGLVASNPLVACAPGECSAYKLQPGSLAVEFREGGRAFPDDIWTTARASIDGHEAIEYKQEQAGSAADRAEVWTVKVGTSQVQIVVGMRGPQIDALQQNLTALLTSISLRP